MNTSLDLPHTQGWEIETTEPEMQRSVKEKHWTVNQKRHKTKERQRPIKVIMATIMVMSFNHCTLGRMKMKSTRRVLGHLLLRSFVESHHSLIRLLRTARFARALRCAHSFAHSLTRSLRSSWERGFCLWNERVDFIRFRTTVQWLPATKSEWKSKLVLSFRWASREM